MTRRNRVRPDGELVAVPDRGLFWGNRGPLLGRDGELARYSSGRRWLICVLEFKGRRRVQWTPGRLTELYFLDEATGLAAGHRPCAECRLAAHREFAAAWLRAYPDEPATSRSSTPGCTPTAWSRQARSARTSIASATCRTARWSRSTIDPGWCSVAGLLGVDARWVRRESAPRGAWTRE